MKMFKKIGLGLAGGFFLFVMLVVAGPTGIAQAADPPSWSGATGVLLKDGSELGVTFKNGAKIPFFDSNKDDDTINFKPASSNSLNAIIWCPNTAYGSSDAAYGITLNSYSAKTASVRVCYMKNGVTETIQTATLSVDTKAYTPPADTGGTTGGNGGGGGETGDTCASSSPGLAGSALSFAMCPAIEGAEAASDALTTQIENLLAFNIGNSINGSEAKTAWNNIRDLSSVLLVIIMLVMVLSQAVSWGPFDAYTVRKVLPRLVIAVIAMQLSWSLLGYVFNIVNDLGRGIADLLYRPFGGSSAVTVERALANSGVSTTAAGAISWVSVLAVGAIAALSLPTIAIMAWSIFVALLTGFIVLIFRQILLIACLIFAPFAILLWIMPGTQRYWKLWYDNLTKTLLMFPMIMGLLASGKIFAMITSGASKSNFLLNFIFVVIGFYGPYFLLPKTYKWGGQAMSMAGQGISAGMQHGTGPVSNWLKGVQERSRWHQARESRKGELMRRAKTGFAEGLTTGSSVRRGLNRSRLLGLHPQELDVNRRLVATARAQREEELQKRAAETIQPFVQAGRSTMPSGRTGFEELSNLALTGEEHEQEASIEALIKGRQWDEISKNGIQNTDAWNRTLTKKGDLYPTVSEQRADYLPQNIAAGNTAAQLASGGVPGVSVAQLGTQSEQFFRDVDEGFGAMPASPTTTAALDSYVTRLQEVARNPAAAQAILGTGKAEYIYKTLQKHAAAHGTPTAPSFADLVQQGRQPGAIPSVGPLVTPVAGATSRIETQPITPDQQNIFNESDTDIVNSRINPAGGWDAYVANNPSEAMFIYQHKSGALKAAAEDALKRANHLP